MPALRKGPEWEERPSDRAAEGAPCSGHSALRCWEGPSRQTADSPRGLYVLPVHKILGEMRSARRRLLSLVLLSLYAYQLIRSDGVRVLLAFAEGWFIHHWCCTMDQQSLSRACLQAVLRDPRVLLMPWRCTRVRRIFLLLFYVPLMLAMVRA